MSPAKVSSPAISGFFGIDSGPVAMMQ